MLPAVVKAQDYEYNEKAQVVKITFPKELSASSGTSALTVEFSGIMNNEASLHTFIIKALLILVPSARIIDGRILQKCIQE